MPTKDYLDRVGLMIGVPLSGNLLVPDWAFAFHALTPPMNYNLRYGYVKNLPVDQARNTLIQMALKDNCEFIFFVDEDVTPPNHALRQLLFTARHYPKAAIIGGIYCHKDPPAAPMVFRGNGAGPYWDWKIGELFDVTGIGMGCTLIRTEVLKDIDSPWFVTVDDSSKHLDGINSSEQWTEDLYFCQKVRKAGWDIMADASVICEHWDTRPCKTGGRPKAVVMPPNSKPYGLAGVEKGKDGKPQKKIVDLGCGEDPLVTDEGMVLTVDIREEVNPDYRQDLRRLPFKTEEFDVVYSSHTLEHFDRAEVPLVLDEWVRILKPEGEFRLHIPNIKWAAEQIMKGVLPDPSAKELTDSWHVLNVLFGSQDYEYNYHKMCFTPESIAAMLKERGFKRIDVDLSSYNILLRAWRIEPDEKTIPKRVTQEQAVAVAVEKDKAGVEPSSPNAVDCYKCGNTGVQRANGFWCDCEEGKRRKEYLGEGTVPITSEQIDEGYWKGHPGAPAGEKPEGAMLTDEQMAEACLPGNGPQKSSGTSETEPTGEATEAGQVEGQGPGGEEKEETVPVRADKIVPLCTHCNDTGAVDEVGTTCGDCSIGLARRKRVTTEL